MSKCEHITLNSNGFCTGCGQLIKPEWNSPGVDTTPIPTELYVQLNYLGLIPSKERSHNVGESNYATKLIQPWSIFLDNPELNYMECDLIKRILRIKSSDSRRLDYEKCQHILTELIRQLDVKESM